MTLERKELIAVWRGHAGDYDAAAVRFRGDGDTWQAELLEATAIDYRQAADELELGIVDERGWSARVVERSSSLAGSPSPIWGGEAGNVDARLVATLTAVAAAVLVVVLAWHVLVAGGVLYAAYRHLTRHTRRRRPKSSWSSLGRTAALMFAAWNSRWLKTTVATPAGKPLRVSVPAAAGRDHVDEDGIPY